MPATEAFLVVIAPVGGDGPRRRERGPTRVGNAWSTHGAARDVFRQLETGRDVLLRLCSA